VLVGVDTGGTFTDFVVQDGTRLRVHKVLSTPADPARAILQGLDDLSVDAARALIHGSTVATNAVLEQKGARTALITTAGFRDVLEIARQTRPTLYDLRVERDPPLVPRELRLEVTERLDERGNVLIELDDHSVSAAVEAAKNAGVDSVAVCLLFSFANPEHERTVTERVRATGLSASASHEVLPEFREYERTSTVVLNAYVAPLMDRYLGNLDQSLPEETQLRIMQSNGGSISAGVARSEAARTLLSGPAAGAVGASYVAEASGFQQTISFDMGGTSSDVALIDGDLTETTDGRVGGHPSRLPMIDIHTVGAGGGSIAWFDAGGALKVGPYSAGASPGPAAYGQGGTEATVTDANVVLGRLSAEDFLGGGMDLDVEAASAVVRKVADRLGSSPEDAALGIVRVTNANMEAAIRVISVEKGYDPRGFTLVAFGGAGPLHACELANAMRIPRVLIPPTPGVLSAYGMLAADLRKDYVQTVMLSPEGDASQLGPVFDEMTEHGRQEILAEGVDPERVEIESYLDMRYLGQSYELTVHYSGSLNDAILEFHAAHQVRFGYSDPDEPVQIVNARVKAFGRAEQPEISLTRYEQESLVTPDRTREVVFAGDDGAVTHRTGIYDRGNLSAGARVNGPAIVTQYDTTTVLPPGWSALVDQAGNLVAEPVEGGSPNV
jgi:N-methylhydantoinase A